MNENRWKNVSWNVILYRFFYAELLLCIVLFAAGRWCGVPTPGFWHILIGTVMVIVLTVLNYTRLRGRLFCTIGVCASIAVVVVFMTPEQLRSFLDSYYSWLFGGGSWLVEQQLLYEIVQSMVLALICYGLQIIFEKLQKVRYVAAALLILFLMVLMFLKVQIGHMGALFVIWYILLSYIEWTKLNWKKERSRDVRSYLLWILPFCTIYFIILAFVPTYEKPYDWQFVKTFVSNAKESVTALVENITRGDSEDFNLKFSGFSDKGNIKGDILDLKQQVMTIQGVSTLKTNIYLTGKVYDHFNGRNWTAETEPYPNERMLDSLETLYAVRMYDGNRDDFVSETRATVRYRYFQSSYLFAPSKTIALYSDKDYSQNTDIRFHRKQGYGTRYELSYLQMNLDQPDFYTYMEQKPPVDKKVWEDLTVRYITDREDRPSWEDMQTYRNMIYDNYTGDLILSDKTRAFVDQLTVGETTPIGKLRAIERELSAYTYTTTPSKVPDWVQTDMDFLDYFLEQKEGYCSYFATAFVLLARAEGLPARYVEGFCVATQPDKEIPIYSGNSHAWPEVYVDGFGWIPFEPTPGYAELRYTPWNIGGTVYSQTAGKPYAYGNGYTEQEVQEQEESLEEELINRQKTERLMRLIGIAVMVVILLLIVFFICERLIRRYRYHHMSIEEQFVVEMKKSLWLLSKMNIEREPYETLQELKKRGEKELPKVKLDFIEFFEAYVYGNEYITKDMLKTTIHQQQELLLWHKNDRKWHYYWLRFMM